MQSISILLQIIAVTAVLGAIVETFAPGIITEKLKSDFTALTIATIGILFSFLLLMWLLKLRIREGFEDMEAMTNWKQIVSYYEFENVCSFYTEVYALILQAQKGMPPSIVSETQAREKTDQMFQNLMSTPLLSCAKFDAVQEATDANTFFMAVAKLPNDFFVQLYETALACRTLLIRQYNQVQDAKKRRAEGFEDKPMCDDDVAEERRKMLREKYLEAQKFICEIPEEIPTQKKNEFAKKKIALLSAMLEKYKQETKKTDTIQKILDDCKYYKEELDKDKQAAENGTIGAAPKGLNVPSTSFF